MRAMVEVDADRDVCQVLRDIGRRIGPYGDGLGRDGRPLGYDPAPDLCVVGPTHLAPFAGPVERSRTFLERGRGTERGDQAVILDELRAPGRGIAGC